MVTEYFTFGNILTDLISRQLTNWDFCHFLFFTITNSAIPNILTGALFWTCVYLKGYCLEEEILGSYVLPTWQFSSILFQSDFAMSKRTTDTEWQQRVAIVFCFVPASGSRGGLQTERNDLFCFVLLFAKVGRLSRMPIWASRQKLRAETLHTIPRRSLPVEIGGSLQRQEEVSYPRPSVV